MDYQIELTTLESKQSELDSLKVKSEDIFNEFNSGYLNQLAGTEIGLLSTKIKQPVERLKKGFTNSNNWYKKYVKELTALEEALSSFSSPSMDTPKVFSAKFEDLFSKQAMGILKTGAITKKQEVETLETPMETVTETGPSGVLEYKVGDLPKPGFIRKYLGRRAVLLDVQVDGHSLGQDGTIKIKKGQTVKLTVRIPDEVEDVELLKRTSADGGGGWQKIVSQKNSLEIKRDNPSTYRRAREYTWYITGNKTTKNVTLSQTVQFSTATNKGSYKGMVRVRVNVVD